jgi:hypothetical protein
MSDPFRPASYHAFLLRFWQESRECPDLPPVWRFSLEATGSGRRHGFASLEALTMFLQQEIDQEGDGGVPAEPEGTSPPG